MPTKNDTKIPRSLYAAAGAGDLAMERLRKLPEKMAALQEQLPGRVSVIGDKVTAKVAGVPSIVAELRQRMVDADTDKLRQTARRNAETFIAQAQAQAKAAQEKAMALYADLVARGEQVVRGHPSRTESEPIHAEVVPTPDASTRTAPTTPDVAEAVEVVHEAAEKAEKAQGGKPAAKATRPRKTAK
jgi:hypothetical protein